MTSTTSSTPIPSSQKQTIKNTTTAIEPKSSSKMDTNSISTTTEATATTKPASSTPARKTVNTPADPKNSHAISTPKITNAATKRTNSNSPTKLATKTKVTPLRKQELLLEARRARVDWVDSSSSSYSSSKQSHHETYETNNANPADDNHAYFNTMTNHWNYREHTMNQDLHLIRMSHAGQSLKSAVDVAKALYGIGEEQGGGFTYPHVQDRIAKQLSSQVSTEDTKKAILDLSPSDSANMLSTKSSSSTAQLPSVSSNENIITTNSEIISNYDRFIQKLRSPESADIVQGTKHFVHSIQEMVNSYNTQLLSTSSSSSLNKDAKEETKTTDLASSMQTTQSQPNNDLLKNVAKSIHSYLDTKLEAIQSMKASAIVIPSSKVGHTKQSSNHQHGLDSKRNELLQKIAKSIQIYLDTTLESMKRNHSSLWISPTIQQEKDADTIISSEAQSCTSKSISEQWDQIKMAFETFIYAKCHDSIWQIVSPLKNKDHTNEMTTMKQDSTKDVQDPDRQILETMKQLQFVNAQHLEIQCILKSDAYLQTTKSQKELHTDEDGKKIVPFDLRQTFAIPIKLLQSIPSRYSPADKLRIIHQTYQQIVSTLSNLSNSSTSSDSFASSKTNDSLPSADDVLPAFIYTLIQAQPYQIVSNILFVEWLSKEDQLKGEAGYAFTNLYGAVQFLLDLNMDIGNIADDTGSDVTSHNDDSSAIKKDVGLSLPFAIKAEEWKAHLMQYKKKKMADILASLEKNNLENDNHNDDENDDSDHSINKAGNQENNNFPSVSEIRAARLRGEVVDLNWVHSIQTQRQNEMVGISNHISDQQVDSPRQNYQKESHSNKNKGTTHSYPIGFTRSYTFLGKKPQDIRIGDIAQLLVEYHQLVNACETMVSERSALQKESQKLRIQKERTKLQSDAVAADVPI